LSNDELLEILSEAKDPVAVQPFIKKCFEAVKELVFESNGEISGMISLEGEKIPFVENVIPATSGELSSQQTCPHEMQVRTHIGVQKAQRCREYGPNAEDGGKVQLCSQDHTVTGCLLLQPQLFANPEAVNGMQGLLNAGCLRSRGPSREPCTALLGRRWQHMQNHLAAAGSFSGLDNLCSTALR